MLATNPEAMSAADAALAGAPACTREAAAIEALRRRGFTATFRAEDRGLRVAGTDRVWSPEEVAIREYYRFEGASDPDDMAVVYALESDDGTRGVLVDAFGAYADPAVGAVLDRMRIVRPGTGPVEGRCAPTAC